jgi:uncharacterized protein YndB with AHSA1/START domain
MITMNKANAFTLQLNKTYPVKQERVFHAWTKPEQLEKWWGPQGFKTTIDEMKVEVNGKYKFNMHAPNGEVHVLAGQYIEIVPNEKLVFTWKWADGDFPATIVKIDFIDKGDSTEVVVTHTELPSEDAAKNHNQGWTSTLEGSLNTYLNK